MSKIIVLSIVLALVFISFQVTSQSSEVINNLTVLSEITYIDDSNIDGPWDGTIDCPYRTINDGVFNSTEGDTIYVFNGTYYENIIIDKRLSIIGEGKTVIDGGYQEYVISIIHDSVVLKDLIISNSGGFKEDKGIFLDSCNNLVIDCEIYRTKIGIYIIGDNNEINNCTIHNNGEGLFLNSSNENKIHGCILGHNSIGVRLNKTQNNKISHCYIHSSSVAILCKGSYDFKIDHCNISDNSVNLGGVFIKDSENIFVNNSILRHNGAGFSIYSSKKISIQNCDLIFNTHFGISLRTPSEDILVTKCEIKNSYRYGVYIEKGNSCKLSNNNIENNYLYSIYSERAKCNARYNWWGKILGPSFINLRPGFRIKSQLSRIKFIPWSIKSFKDIGANWEENEMYLEKEVNYNVKNMIELPGIDSDCDGVPNWWEEKWGYNSTVWNDHTNLDPDEDALNNFEECYTDQWNSNPYKKDVFVEIDWFESPSSEETNRPSEEKIAEIIDIFEEKNITLHVDIGQMGGGGEIPLCDVQFSYSELRDCYWKHFLNNDLKNPRKGVFRYGLICNYCPDVNFPFMGWDNLDFFAISAEWLKQIVRFKEKEDLIIGATVHHLGHTFGLKSDVYNGIDNLDSNNPLRIEFWKFKNYKSVMNYFYKYKILSYSDGSHGRGDFNDWDSLDFEFFKNSDFKNNGNMENII